MWSVGAVSRLSKLVNLYSVDGVSTAEPSLDPEESINDVVDDFRVCNNGPTP